MRFWVYFPNTNVLKNVWRTSEQVNDLAEKFPTVIFFEAFGNEGTD